MFTWLYGANPNSICDKCKEPFRHSPWFKSTNYPITKRPAECEACFFSRLDIYDRENDIKQR